MKKSKFRSWAETIITPGEKNTEKSKTMPDMSINPRTIIENHVRGINPITGAVLDRGIYYGDNQLPHYKDLTYEEIRIKRQELERYTTELVNNASPSVQTMDSQQNPNNTQTETNNPPAGEQI